MDNTANGLAADGMNTAAARVPFRAWVFLDGATGTSIGLACELSAAGIVVISGAYFCPGEKLEAQFMLPNGQDVQCDVEVLGTEDNRVHLRLLELDATERVAAADLLRSQHRSFRAPGRSSETMPASVPAL